MALAEQLNDLMIGLHSGIEEQREIAEIVVEMGAMLLSKNRKYGSSASNPIRVFSKLPPIEGINIRLDDKLSRIRNGAADEDEDPDFDMVGYLILRINEKRRLARQLEESEIE